MTRRFRAALTAALTATGLALAGCGQEADNTAEAKTEASAAPATAPADKAPAAAPAISDLGAAEPAAAGAPAFAVVYPGAIREGPATLAQGPSGPGGILGFTTEATPEQVIEFYRVRSEAAGLKSINAMNQGGALGYSAGDGADGRGELLSVVATPVDGGLTRVQLDWSAGR
jgi:hypothetical protein